MFVPLKNMPVTQPKPDLKAPVNMPMKAHKSTKSPLKLHAPGFHYPVCAPAGLRGKRDPADRNEQSKFAATRVARAPRASEYTHTDAYGSFFAGSQTLPGLSQVPQLNNTYLRPNAKFVGLQKSGRHGYDIEVQLKSVDLMSSIVTGFFQISRLTEEHPVITTCFKGEIINNPLHRMEWGNASVAPKRYSFVTDEKSGRPLPKNDLDHWKKLTGCVGHATELEVREKLRLIQAGIHDPDLIYMRWKEEFLVPDSRIKQLNGASFEGFYYVVLNIGTGANSTATHRNSAGIAPGAMSGLYFYTQSEKFQSLSLEYVEDRGQTSTFDFA